MDDTGYSFRIGKTPLIRLERISALCGCDVFAKQERCNPTGSVKDRVAWYMVRDAMDRGILRPGSGDVTIIEATSGNAGISIAAVGAALRIPVCIVMPDSISLERRKMMSIYNAKLILTPGAEGMRGAVEEAEKIMKHHPGRYFMPMQFRNPANVRAHFETTGPEIAAELGDKVDYWVAGVGSGGTLTGTGNFLKQLNPDLKVIAVEPATSAIIGQRMRGMSLCPGRHGIQGIGANFIPDILDMELLDGAIGIETAEAILQGRELLRRDAISTGISGGCNIAAVLELASGGAFKPGMKVVTVIPDGVEKYMATPLGE